MTLLPKRFLADPNTIHDALKWVLIIEVVTTLVFVFAMLYITNKEVPTVIDPALLKEMQKANEEHRQALDKSDMDRQRTVELLNRKDSLIQVEMNQNRNAINNERKQVYDKINRIDKYLSDDILREFAKLTDTTAH